MSNNEELFFNVQQKTDKQHILDNPDTYIGSVENVNENCWIYDETEKKIKEKNISIIPGLFKLFDEGIVNCRDHVIRMQTKVDNKVEHSLPVTYIDVSIENDGTIIMVNDGNGIDVALHPEYKLWIPELIFGHLRTSTNYNKEEKTIIGGKNGFGFKLVLIWSSYGYIETVDHIRGLKYTQEFKNNLDEICEPKISKCSKKPYTKIIFKPDYKRLGLDGLENDMKTLFIKRIYDISAVTDKSIKVKYNSSIISTKTFEQYISLYVGDKSDVQRVYEKINDRWEYAVALTTRNEFTQISFVNGIYTSKGGKHVEYVLNQITKKLVDYIENKKKIKVNPNSIKEQLFLFLRCDVEQPSFDSQTKDYMNTPATKFGSKCVVSDKFIEKVAKMGVMETACSLTEIKENKIITKKDGTKTKTIKGIPKLEDANYAGTNKSNECILFLTEGDSAKSGVLSGLSSEDRNYIGVYPLKGKLLNVRGEKDAKIFENTEINELQKIIGLEYNKEYTQEDVYKCLRYSKIVLITDQDLDGSHIKGLAVNLFQDQWQSLFKMPEFLGFMNTPILKAKKGNTQLTFYNQGEYDNWKNNTPNYDKWDIKYYKGLGTSVKKEFIEYLKEKKIVWFDYAGEKSDDCIDMIFNKKRPQDRKMWLETQYNRDNYVDTSKNKITYEDFVNKEFIHFSKYDCDRSIPNLMDGLKISLRKILFCAFKRKLVSEIKVAQFSGAVSEISCYHHGEESLNKAIVGMAQNFVGSNNINLLTPSGQFGTRLQGGNDSASPRYIFTKLEKITRFIYPEVDDAILNYLNDDGTIVEPQFYIPIIPMILINGGKGIGTAFSSEILCYNPSEIIDYLKNKLNDEHNSANEHKTFMPYYRGFKGEIIKLNQHQFLFKGKYKLDKDKNILIVYELPIGTWTDDYKVFLEKLQNDKVDKDGTKIPAIVKNFENKCTDETVYFEIEFYKGKLNEMIETQTEHGCNKLEKTMKLYSIYSSGNMHLFDKNDELKKFNSVSEIIDEYYKVRLEYYDIRKAYLLKCIESELLFLKNKVKYIEELLTNSIDLRNMKKTDILQMLKNKGYHQIDEEYNYLIKMPMDSVSNENVIKLNEHLNKINNDKIALINKTSKQMWLEELIKLEKEYLQFISENENNFNDITNTKNNKTNTKSKKTKT